MAQENFEISLNKRKLAKKKQFQVIDWQAASQSFLSKKKAK